MAAFLTLAGVVKVANVGSGRFIVLFPVIVSVLYAHAACSRW